MSKLLASKLVSWVVSNKDINHFVQNLDKKNFKFTSLSDLSVENLVIRPGCLEGFPVPIDIRSGRIGKVSFQWKGTLGVSVNVEDVHVTFVPKAAAGRMDEVKGEWGRERHIHTYIHTYVLEEEGKGRVYV